MGNDKEMGGWPRDVAEYLLILLLPAPAWIRDPPNHAVGYGSPRVSSYPLIPLSTTPWMK
jgi:hypothetical protein